MRRAECNFSHHLTSTKCLRFDSLLYSGAKFAGTVYITTLALIPCLSLILSVQGSHDGQFHLKRVKIFSRVGSLL